MMMIEVEAASLAASEAQAEPDSEMLVVPVPLEDIVETLNGAA